MPEPLTAPDYQFFLTTSEAYPYGVTDAESIPYRAFEPNSFRLGMQTYLGLNFFGLEMLSEGATWIASVGTPLPEPYPYTGIDTVHNQPTIQMPYPWELPMGLFGGATL